jgi:hypothetical protein
MLRVIESPFRRMTMNEECKYIGCEYHRAMFKPDFFIPAGGSFGGVGGVLSLFKAEVVVRYKPDFTDLSRAVAFKKIGESDTLREIR